MIRSIKFKSGHAIDLPSIGKRAFKFTDSHGVNLLFGPNGSGKTTVLLTIGAYCGCKKEGGLSSFVDPFQCMDKKSYPSAFEGIVPDCTADVDWDGTPTFMQRSDHDRFVGFDEPTDGLLSNSEQVRETIGHDSSGQKRITRMNKTLAAISDYCGQHDLLLEKPQLYQSSNHVWRKSMDDFIAYIRTKPRGGPITVILDEPDRCLGLVEQHIFWTQVMPKLSQEVQVIISSHSCFALKFPKIKVFAFGNKYLETACDALGVDIETLDISRRLVKNAGKAEKARV